MIPPRAARKVLDDAKLLAACTGRTCKVIARELGEDYFVVRRHLKRLTAMRLLVAHNRPGRGGIHVCYSRVQ